MRLLSGTDLFDTAVRRLDVVVDRNVARVDDAHVHTVLDGVAQMPPSHRGTLA